MDLAFTPALEQARLVRDGEVKPIELVELYARRIEEIDQRINSYLTLCLDRALDEAADIETPRDGEGLFHGVPISIKDLYDVEGVRTTFGSGAFSDNIAEEDEVAVARVRGLGGFIVLGKTNTPEFGSVPWTEPVAYGPCRNPWDLERTPGGSSGGAAAALAAGLCPISYASDGGGSIRIPASACGVFGIKPSRGRVTSAPQPTSLLSQRGPIARTVADAAALLDVMAGPATGDMYWASPPQRPFLGETRVAPGRLRIAFTDRPISPVAVADANRLAVAEAARLLEELGHEVVEAAPPASEELLYRFLSLWTVQLASRRPMPSLDQVEPLNRALIEMGRTMSATDYLGTLSDLHDALHPVMEFFHEHDALLTPTVATSPPLIGEFRDLDQPLNEIIRAGSFAPFSSLWNVTGQPAVSVPWTEDEAGLPIGVQLVGRPADESTLIRLSAQLEQARPWAHRRPAL
jgi:amidase